MGFSQSLSYLIKKAQVSNYRLAQDIGVSQSTVANWLNEKSTPGIKKLHEIAEYFNVSVDYLLNECGVEDVIISKSSAQEELVKLVEDLSDDETEDVKKYVEFIKSKRPN